MKILVVTPGLKSKASFISDAFREKYAADVIPGKRYRESRLDRLKGLLGAGAITKNVDTLNREILFYARDNEIDLVCVIKGNYVKGGTLEAVRAMHPNCRIVCWTCDDMFLPHNHSRIFLESAPCYDIIFTAKSLNVSKGELKQLGFKHVEFLYQAYSKAHHFPIRKQGSEYVGKVIFVGYGEDKRFDYMRFLADHGVPVHVYGNGWDKRRYRRYRNDRFVLHRRPLLGRDYTEALTNAAISLCFLRQLNRDLHTSRTFEIPACGGFMLGERTVEHEHLFQEGIEAEYFDSNEELLEKVRYYLDHPAERAAIADRGFRRTRRDDYSYHGVVDKMMTRIFVDEPCRRLRQSGRILRERQTSNSEIAIERS